MSGAGEGRTARLYLGDCLDALRTMPAASVDAVVCDPPYELGFMGKSWDSSGIAFDPATWREALRVLKPGGHLLAFGGTRTYHRIGVAIEDAGFEIRDSLIWQYSSGFPKSLNVAIAIDKAAGAMGHRGKAIIVAGDGGQQANLVNPQGAPAHEPITDGAKRWTGWGTALKPAFEPVVVARKPLEGTAAANVLKYGTGALNVDGCRVASADALVRPPIDRQDNVTFNKGLGAGVQVEPGGRWPANVLFTHAPGCGAEACEPGCPVAALDAQSGVIKNGNGMGGAKVYQNECGQFAGMGGTTKLIAHTNYHDTGGASRFFTVADYGPDDDLPGAQPGEAPFLYQSKANRKEREAGCEGLPARTGAEAVGREEGSAGTQSPRAGAGRTADSVRNHHNTVKPVAVMRWLCRLVTPPGGTVLDPFMGSGTTGIAALREGFDFIGCEREPEYLLIAEARIAHHAPDARLLGPGDP